MILLSFHLKCSQSALSEQKQRDRNVTLPKFWLPSSLKGESDTEMVCPAEAMCLSAQGSFHLRSEVLEMHLGVGRDYFGSLC